MKLLVVISKETDFEKEAEIVNELFEEGLTYFHLRKPAYSENNVHKFMRMINKEHHTKIVFHQCHQLSGTYTNRLHYSTNMRNTLSDTKLNRLKENIWLSTSVHTVEEIESFTNSWNHVFYGPVNNSISKHGYYATIDKTIPLPDSQNVKKIIALGGIDTSNIRETLEIGFDGVAVLGALWGNPSEAVSTFITLQKLCK